VEENESTLYDALHRDHQRLDALFEELLNHVHVNDAQLIDATWTRFERGLLAHLEAEEQHMLPALEREDPAVAARVREEHAQIRAALAELGVGVEIHIVREEMVERFVQLLRAHGKREEETVYRWADRALDNTPKQSILDRLRSAAAIL
jgi:hemerythrin superfamily protein